MRPRLFSLMLTAFGLVIVLGLGGMLGSFWLAASVVRRESPEGWPGQGVVLARREAQRLATFYARRDSWEGVEGTFATVARRLAAAEQIALVDTRGVVVASSRPDLAPVGEPYRPAAFQPLDPPAPPAPPDLPALPDEALRGQADHMADVRFVQSLEITVERRQVGTLLVGLDSADLMMAGESNVRRTARGLLGAAVGLGLVLLSLAAVFSGRISRPLRQLTGAARALATGDMSARVRPANVRELDELAGAFNGMAEALLRADQQRRQLTADVAHELRTPLSVIKGRLEGIEDGVYQADQGQIAGLLGEVALLERLIEDLRLLALADAGQLPLYPEPSDPARLAEEARRSFAEQAAARGVALVVVAPAGLPEISADTQRIAQVLGNLLANALRHTPAGGQVTLRVALGDQPGAAAGPPPGARRSPSIIFSIADTGSGIDPADLPHIFDRFYRADRSRARGSGGAGLGLAIARRIVEAHGGQIRAESAAGQGTTVSFSLPAGPSRQASAH